MGNLLRKVLPRPLRNLVRNVRRLAADDFGRPRMVWGFVGPDGIERPRTRISDSAFFQYRERIRIADNVFVWHYTILDGTAGIEIGEGTQIGAWVGLLTHSSHLAIRLYGRHYQDVPEAEKQAFQTGPIRIGRYVFVGARSVILPGVTIGDGAIVAAGSLVNRDVEPFQVVSGTPATPTGDTRLVDKRYLKDPQLAAWYREWQDADDR